MSTTTKSIDVKDLPWTVIESFAELSLGVLQYDEGTIANTIDKLKTKADDTRREFTAAYTEQPRTNGSSSMVSVDTQNDEALAKVTVDLMTSTLEMIVALNEDRALGLDDADFEDRLDDASTRARTNNFDTKDLVLREKMLNVVREFSDSLSLPVSVTTISPSMAQGPDDAEVKTIGDGEDTEGVAPKVDMPDIESVSSGNPSVLGSPLEGVKVDDHESIVGLEALSLDDAPRAPVAEDGADTAPSVSGSEPAN